MRRFVIILNDAPHGKACHGIKVIFGGFPIFLIGLIIIVILSIIFIFCRLAFPIPLILPLLFPLISHHQIPYLLLSSPPNHHWPEIRETLLIPTIPPPVIIILLQIRETFLHLLLFRSSIITSMTKIREALLVFTHPRKTHQIDLSQVGSLGSSDRSFGIVVVADALGDVLVHVHRVRHVRLTLLLRLLLLGLLSRVG